VLSGLALGIDGAAHRGALEAGGVTVAVLGGGPDRPTPRAHAALADETLREGCLLSEFPPGIAPRPHHFPRRNRILAALGERIVVVEAARRSGALITARLALDLGREVWAVPSPIFSSVCEGTHLLLEDGARPVVTPDRWIESLGGKEVGGRGAGPPGEAPDSWDSTTRAVWNGLADDPRTLDELVSGAGLQAAAVLASLTALELDGWIQRDPTGAFHRRAA
jgi:DNA processing protein